MLETVVFLCGAMVMVMELAGSRALAPFLGTSIIVWTSLIGVILAALSLGYWLGGLLSDRNPSRRSLSRLILMAAFWLVGVAQAKDFVLEVLTDMTPSLRLGGVLAAIILFAVPSLLLGMVSPYAARLSITDVERSGATVGRLYALSTIGSIAGTFLAGFWLIALFGTANIILFTGLILAGASTLLWRGDRAPAALLAVAAAGLMVGGFGHVADVTGGETLDVDTPYNRVLVRRAILLDTGRPALTMSTDPGKLHSATYLDDPSELALTYTRFYRLAERFRPGAARCLMIGGGGYSLPKYLLAESRSLERLDVAEIDPGITALAREYFSLRDDPRLRVFDEDGRTFLNRAAKAARAGKTDGKYDVVYCDAFNSWYSIPFHLTTIEAMRQIDAVLADDGVVLINVISAARGEAGAFFRAQRRTLLEVFPRVEAFLTREPDEPGQTQNIMLAAFKNPRPPAEGAAGGDATLDEMLAHRLEESVPLDMPVLTDDYAPVDAYLLKLLKG